MHLKKTRIFTLIAAILILGGTGWVSWYLFGPLIRTEDHQPVSIYIPEGSDYNAVTDTLRIHKLINHPSLFKVLAAKKHYPTHIHSGRYLIRDKTSYNTLINMLRAGLQSPVTVTFNHQRSLAQLAGNIGRQLELDSLELIQILHNQSVCRQLGFDTSTIAAIFLPNTYEFYWNISAKGFLERMKKEYDAFWTPDRIQEASDIGLTPLEVVVLASIVEEETYHAEEMPVIAGVYLNRLHKGMRLQADPTVKFAVGDVTKRRILTKDLQIDSPYNTYRFKGLPPGPITLPSKQAGEAVLHAERHSYLYFCAKEDFSGYHYFSKTLREHNRNAYKYRQILNRNHVYH